ncbi:hypothetical protein KMC60_gp19 [Achromobacter phage vB_AxyP_19-32_Axy11]|uniref:Uncharacterized protein n=1 Tax=Achromobacter phage vB_AxyP_19-32_Axy11 TaxID=2591042 RepID=A0A514CUB0_9CAUD|nr:hypothetical protein KMC60_gp19 [Achromobacter phage vB_AxyP_19-32_Axy11]QDH84062.1 hypothetical protein Axy11_019 [Achromobacter phage vB_AxyP_19-32_Axy11]
MHLFTMQPNKKTDKHIQRYITEVTSKPGQWVYVSRAKHSKNARDYIVDTVKSIIEMMGVSVEIDGYHKCRLRIKP